MRGKIMFLGGLAAGFVLGARAGREKYEELMVQAKKVMDHPTVQEATGVAQAQASRLYEQGKDRLGTTKLGEKIGSTSGNGTTSSGSISPGGELTSSDTLAATSGSSTGSSTGSTTGSSTGSGTGSTTGSSTGSSSSTPPMSSKPRTTGSTTASSSGTDI